MGLKLKVLHLKFKAFSIRRFLLGPGFKNRDRHVKTKPSWMVSVTHGYHVTVSADSKCDSIVVQRDQVGDIDLWFFGIFDARIGNGVAKHFFGRKLKQSEIRGKCKEATKRAYQDAMSNMKLEKESGERISSGAASATVINGEKLVLANMGDYRAVVCRDGVAHRINSSHPRSAKRHWPYRLFFSQRITELVVSQRIDSSVEFVILASRGIWEVLQAQEAVSLISHIEHPQAAAECLAKEAVNRMSKSNISCLIIRFD